VTDYWLLKMDSAPWKKVEFSARKICSMEESGVQCKKNLVIYFFFIMNCFYEKDFVDFLI